MTFPIKPAAVAAGLALALAVVPSADATVGKLKIVPIGTTVTLRGAQGQHLRARAYDFRLTDDCDWLTGIGGACAQVRLTIRNTGRVPLRIASFVWFRWLSARGAWVGQNHRGQSTEGPLVAKVYPGRLWRYELVSRLFDKDVATLRYFELRAGDVYGPYPRDRARWVLPPVGVSP
jgi:hypothetical protein